MVFLEGILRPYARAWWVNKNRFEYDSFSGPLVDYPEFTEPVVWQGLSVPDVLRSGNHAAMAAWRADQALERTVRDILTGSKRRRSPLN